MSGISKAVGDAVETVTQKLRKLGPDLKAQQKRTAEGGRDMKTKGQELDTKLAAKADAGSNSSNNNSSSNSGGRERGPDGRFLPNNDAPIDKRYERPSGWRAGKRDEVWEAAKGPDGLVRDPVTREVIDKDSNWVMGHAPGHEFRHHQRSAQERGISREQFLDEYYSSNYRPETQHTSSSGSHELPWERYVGP